MQPSGQTVAQAFVVDFILLQREHLTWTCHNTEVTSLAAFAVDFYSSYNFSHDVLAVSWAVRCGIEWTLIVDILIQHKFTYNSFYRIHFN